EKCPAEPARDSLSSQVVGNPHPLDGVRRVEHGPNLSTPDRPMVPLKERDHPNTPEDNKLVLSRDGYLCRIPGCGEMATQNHHIVDRAHGYPTVRPNVAGLCDEHDALDHQGPLLISVNGDRELTDSDNNCRPLDGRAGDQAQSVEFEVDPAPKTDAVPAGRDLEPCSIPKEVTADWWRKHRLSLEYSEKRNAWAFKPFEDLATEAPEVEPR